MPTTADYVALVGNGWRRMDLRAEDLSQVFDLVLPDLNPATGRAMLDLINARGGLLAWLRKQPPSVVPQDVKHFPTSMTEGFQREQGRRAFLTALSDAAFAFPFTVGMDDDAIQNMVNTRQYGGWRFPYRAHFYPEDGTPNKYRRVVYLKLLDKLSSNADVQALRAERNGHYGQALDEAARLQIAEYYLARAAEGRRVIAPLLYELLGGFWWEAHLRHLQEMELPVSNDEYPIPMKLFIRKGYCGQENSDPHLLPLAQAIYHDIVVEVVGGGALPHGIGHGVGGGGYGGGAGAHHEDGEEAEVDDGYDGAQEGGDGNHDNGGVAQVGGYAGGASLGDGEEAGVEEEEDEEDDREMQTSDVDVDDEDDMSEASTSEPDAQGQQRPREEDDGEDRDQSAMQLHQELTDENRDLAGLTRFFEPGSIRPRRSRRVVSTPTRKSIKRREKYLTRMVSKCHRELGYGSDLKCRSEKQVESLIVEGERIQVDAVWYTGDLRECDITLWESKWLGGYRCAPGQLKEYRIELAKRYRVPKEKIQTRMGVFTMATEERTEEMTTRKMKKVRDVCADCNLRDIDFFVVNVVDEEIKGEEHVIVSSLMENTGAVRKRFETKNGGISWKVI